jgi:integrase
MVSRPVTMIEAADSHACAFIACWLALAPSDRVEPKAPLSSMAMAMLLRRMKSDVTVHGFRSTFRDWASETTSFPHEVCEMALAHTIANKAEAAYRRGDLFDKRRKLMEAWAGYCASAGSGKVVKLKATRLA